MDLREIRQLIKIVESSNIHEFELEEEGTKLRISKAAPAEMAVTYSVPQVQQPIPVAAPVQSGAAAPAAESAAPAEAEIDKNHYEIRSPWSELSTVLPHRMQILILRSARRFLSAKHCVSSRR